MFERVYARKGRLVLVLILVAIALSSTSTQLCADAKEIVATHEWQEVKEGDTIPQGLHIKIDLETGMKWAKLLSDNDKNLEVSVQDDGGEVVLAADKAEQKPTREIMSKEVEEDQNLHIQNAIKITQLANSELTAEASAKVTSQLLEQAERRSNAMESIASLNDFEGDTTTGELEHEMMYRTLLSLPTEEILASGLALPIPPAENASQDVKSEFEKQIREIWKVRQDLLKSMEEEYLADVTDIINERINSLKDYFADPMKHIRQIMTSRRTVKEDGIEIEDLSLITGVLNDLEFQLIDLDNARDFHSMGGWPILVALLTDSVHGLEYEFQKEIDLAAQQLNRENVNVTEGEDVAIKLSENATEFLKEYQRVVWEIQGLACWCMGTAVKNVEEFHSWATEDFSHMMSPNTNTGIVNVITIIINKLHAESNTDNSILDISSIDDKLQMRQKFEIYALGALLRGNKEATHYFNSINGATTLYDIYSNLTKDTEHVSSIDTMTMKLVNKIISLVDDLIMDASLHPSNNSELDAQLISALTTVEWCNIPIRLVDHPSKQVQRKMIETMINIRPFCRYGDDQIESVVRILSKNEESDEELDGLINKLHNKSTRTDTSFS